MNGDTNTESPEAKKARIEEKAEKASQEYKEKATVSEKSFTEKVKGIFTKETITKIAILQVLDFPFLAGYSVADLYVAAEGVLDIIHAIAEKDLEKGVRGGLKIAISAVPGLPVAGAAPIFDQLLPDKQVNN